MTCAAQKKLDDLSRRYRVFLLWRHRQGQRPAHPTIGRDKSATQMTKFIKFSISFFFLPAFGTLKAQPTAENINRILLDEMKREHIPGAQLTILYKTRFVIQRLLA